MKELTAESSDVEEDDLEWEKGVREEEGVGEEEDFEEEDAFGEEDEESEVEDMDEEDEDEVMEEEDWIEGEDGSDKVALHFIDCIVQDKQKADANIVLFCSEAAMHALKHRFPHMTKIIVQSDNAKNLAGKQSKQFLPHVCSAAGLKLVACYHNETQSGKDVCVHTHTLFPPTDPSGSVLSTGRWRCASVRTQQFYW